MKITIKQNIWGNAYGYVGSKKVKAFTLGTLQCEIDEWIEEQKTAIRQKNKKVEIKVDNQIQ